MRRTAHRFPLPNEIWKWKLKPAEFVLLSYLYYNAHSNRAKLTPKLLAEAVHLCEDTTRKHLTTLTEKKLVTPELTPTLPCDSGGNFFSLPVEIFLLDIPATALAVYAYLLYRENRRTGKCHPASSQAPYRSLPDKPESSLTPLLLLFPPQPLRWVAAGFLENDFNGNNLYTILPVRPVVNEHYQRQIRRLEADVERQRIQKRLAKMVAGRELKKECAL